MHLLGLSKTTQGEGDGAGGGGKGLWWLRAHKPRQNTGRSSQSHSSISGACPPPPNTPECAEHRSKQQHTSFLQPSLSTLRPPATVKLIMCLCPQASQYTAHWQTQQRRAASLPGRGTPPCPFQWPTQAHTR
jgi:hypothetical protein